MALEVQQPCLTPQLYSHWHCSLVNLMEDIPKLSQAASATVRHYHFAEGEPDKPAFSTDVHPALLGSGTHCTK